MFFKFYSTKLLSLVYKESGRVEQAQCKSKKGFTLAEVLVTLTVIGIVASLTIPNLVSRTTDKQNLIAWKKQFNVAAQVVKQIEAENGSINFDATSVRGEFEPYMKFLKKGDSLQPFLQELNGGTMVPYYLYKRGDSAEISMAMWQESALLADGSIWSFNNYGGKACTGTSASLTGICGHFSIDVNGIKKPNMAGKDFFKAWIVRKNGTYVVYPAGSHSDENTCVAGAMAESESYGCSYYALTKTVDTMP